MLALPPPAVQLAHLVADFMQQPGVDPQVERSFKEYLMQRATR
jgi:hypothetical protein